jgi:hypothetical protein
VKFLRRHRDIAKGAKDLLRRWGEYEEMGKPEIGRDEDINHGERRCGSQTCRVPRHHRNTYEQVRPTECGCN